MRWSNWTRIICVLMLATMMLSTRYILMDPHALLINFAKLSLHNNRQLRQFIPLHKPKAPPGSPPKLPPAHALNMKNITTKMPSSIYLLQNKGWSGTGRASSFFSTNDVLSDFVIGGEMVAKSGACNVVGSQVCWTVDH